MNSLLRFILKYQFVLLFIALEFISLWLLAKHTYYQKSKFESVARSAMGYANEKIDNSRAYFRLAEVNQSLAKENLELRTQIAKLSHTIERAELLHTKTDVDSLHVFMPAKIINQSINKRHNYLTLNIGKKHGVEPEMGVVTNNGVVGIVVGVSDNYSTVISLLNIDLKISAKLKSTNYFGSLYWDGKSTREVVLGDIPQHVELTAGDTITTSGFSAIFPNNINLGTIKSFEISGSNFFTIRAQLFNDFQQLSHVWVVKSTRNEEREKLEELTIQN